MKLSFRVWCGWVALALWMVTAAPGQPTLPFVPATSPAPASGSDAVPPGPSSVEDFRAGPTTAPALAPAPGRRAAALATTLPAHMTALPSGANVAIIRISGMIYDFTVDSFHERVEHALADGASLIVVELDTPGGLLESALKLSKEIKSLNVPTIAWVHDQAYSAGTLIAASCRYIVMSPHSMMGDCAPIVPGMNLSPTERAKALSPLLEEFRDSALLNNYDFAAFQAMCELGVKLYFIEDPRSGQRRLVNEADHRWMVLGQDTPVALNPDITAVARQVGTDADRAQWREVTQGRYLGNLVQPVHDGTSLFTLSQERAIEFGVAQVIVADDAALQTMLAAAQVGRYHPTTMQGVAYWLTRPWMRALLLMTMMICFYLEFMAPGISLPGIIGTICLVMLLGAPFIIGLTEWWHVMLFFIGLILLLVELFITPGFGLLGISGIVLMFTGLALATVPTAGGGLPAPQMMNQLQWSALSVLVGVVLTAVAFYFLTRHFGRLPVFNRMILEAEQRSLTAPAPPGSTTPGAAATAAADGGAPQGGPTVRVGDQAVVSAGLKPTGRIELNGQWFDATSRGEWVAAGQTVRVVEVRGNLIVVEPVA